MNVGRPDIVSWSCLRKVRYKRKGAALRQLARMKRSGHCESDLHVYWCRYCGGYHIGRDQKRGATA